MPKLVIGIFADDPEKIESGGPVVTTRLYSLVVPAGGGTYNLNAEDTHRRRIAEFTTVGSTANSTNQTIPVRELYAAGQGYFLEIDPDKDVGASSGRLWWSSSCDPTPTDASNEGDCGLPQVEADRLARQQGSKSRSILPAEDF